MVYGTDDSGTDYVALVLTADIPFTTFAETYNQFQSATGLQDMEQEDDALTVYNEIVQLSLLSDGGDAVRRAFDLSSGEVHASAQHVIGQSFGLFSHLLRGQGAAGVGTGNAGGQVFTAPLGYAATPPARTMATGVAGLGLFDSKPASAWLAPLGGRGTVDGDGNAAALDWRSLGLAGGYEAPVAVARGEAFAGFGVGYIASRGSVDDRLSSFEADGFHIGAYGGWTDGPWRLTGSLAYAAHSISTTRHIFIGDTIDETAMADYWGHSIGFSGEAAYGIGLGNGTTLSPLATLDAGWSGHGGFTETGAGALNLTGDSESWTRFDLGLGVALSHSFATESGNKVTLDGRLVWEHAFADVVPSQSLSFAGSPTPFAVNGPDAGRDRLRLGLGLSFQASDDLTIRAGYTGLFSGSQHSHAASVGLNLRF